MTHGEIKQALYHRNEIVLPSARCITLHQMDKILFGGSVFFFQHLLHHILHHQGAFAGIQNTESRIQIDIRKIVPHHIQTEAVNGRDLRIMQKCRLTVHTQILRMLRHIFRDGFADTLAHLCRRCLCKRHDQHTVDIHRMPGIRQ